ncbi:protein-tyrosine sulfotransferase 1-like [Tubulanus polymorphus]|uniref:protein-tyrosine sulfotransferase 1-like n=1 Tax=Tubulanus polymorphus TaxID=672921 RepID=UPI003DA28B7A
MSRAEGYKILSIFLGFVILIYVLRDLTEVPKGSDDEFYIRKIYQRHSQKKNANESLKQEDEMVYTASDVPLIWIGGVPRSGTTLSRALLDAHPDVRCGEETRVIPQMLSFHARMQNSELEKARLDEAKVTVDVMESALKSYILSIIVNHGEPALRYCNKDPFTLRSMNLILRLFPNSKFILMVRDGRAVVHSIISRKVLISGFNTDSYSDALRDWNRAFYFMYKLCLQNSKVCMPVPYEKLVIDPEPQLRRIFKFLDIPWNDIVLHHERTIGKRGGVSLSRKEASTDQVNKPINTKALYEWVKHMPKMVKDNAAVIAPMLKVVGYDPDNPVVNYGTKPEELATESMD